MITEPLKGGGNNLVVNRVSNSSTRSNNKAALIAHQTSDGDHLGAPGI